MAGRGGSVSSCFRRIAEAETAPTEMYLLYVGRPSKAVDSLLERARGEKWFERVVAVDCGGDGLDRAGSAVEEHDLRAARYGQGLVVLWDLDALEGGAGSGPGADDDRVPRISESLRKATDWSPDHAAFGLTSAGTDVSFLELTDFLGHDVAAIGDDGQAAATLQAWSRPFPDGGGVGLRGAFDKSPSGWLSAVRHDYLANGILSEKVVPALERAGLALPHAELDFWQHHLRNLLLCPRKYGRYRLPLRQIFGEVDIDRRYEDLDLTVLAPRWLAGAAGEGGGEGHRFELYGSADEARTRAATLGESGWAWVVLWDVELDPEPPRIPGMDRGAPAAPVVLTSPHEPPAFEWRRWQELLARNVLGGFSKEELLAPADPGGEGPRRLERLVSTWRAFCLAPPLAVVPWMRDLMAETHDRLGDRVPERKAKIVYRAMAAVEVARARHFGAFPADD